MQEAMIARAKELLKDGSVNRVIGWKKGEFSYDISPAVFTTPEQLDAEFVYDDFCGANVSKYVMKEAKKEGKVLAFIKPCDSYSFAQLLKEHRFDREKVYAIGIPCYGKADIAKIREKGIDGVLGIREEGSNFVIDSIYGDATVAKCDVLAERCLNCKSKKHVDVDEMLGEEGEWNNESGRFDEVARLEAMTPDERYEFWRGELSRCIRCNACRNVCPACTCENCVFDNPNSDINNKAAATSFEENMYHIIRAFHVAGRCTDCGECSRVCPQNIPIHLLNRKFIKDINELYGEYQAGANPEERYPLVNFNYGDCEPGIVYKRGGNQ